MTSIESARPAIGWMSSRITAAATTGPASGPRPASSTPAIRPTPSQLKPSCSGTDDLGDRIAGLLRGIAAQRQMLLFEDGLRLRIADRIVQPGQTFACQRLGRALILDQLRHDEVARQHIGQADPGLVVAALHAPPVQ